MIEVYNLGKTRYFRLSNNRQLLTESQEKEFIFFIPEEEQLAIARTNEDGQITLEFPNPEMKITSKELLNLIALVWGNETETCQNS